MVKFASELFPGVPALHAQLQDNFLPDFAVFLERSTAEFEKWSRKWKLPTHLMTYWQHFLVQEWQLLESNSKNTVWTTSSLKPVRVVEPLADAMRLLHEQIYDADGAPKRCEK